MVTLTLSEPNHYIKLNPNAPEYHPGHPHPSTLVPYQNYYPIPPPPPQTYILWQPQAYCFISPHAPLPSKKLGLLPPPHPIPSNLPLPTDNNNCDQVFSFAVIKPNGRRKMVLRRHRRVRCEITPTIHTPLAYYPFSDCTSLMIRNIPTRLRRGELMGLLDDHCREENERICFSKSNEPLSEFDFLYLPIDFKKQGNKGYAFVNFTSWEGASRLFNSWKDTTWNSCGFSVSSYKVCQFSRANLQGKEALARHFARSVFVCGTDDYLPVVITPARNGANGDVTSLIVIGTRVDRWLSSVKPLQLTGAVDDV